MVLIQAVHSGRWTKLGALADSGGKVHKVRGGFARRVPKPARVVELAVLRPDENATNFTRHLWVDRIPAAGVLPGGFGGLSREGSRRAGADRSAGMGEVVRDGAARGAARGV